jgi:hypothetical protein
VGLGFLGFLHFISVAAMELKRWEREGESGGKREREREREREMSWVSKIMCVSAILQAWAAKVQVREKNRMQKPWYTYIGSYTIRIMLKKGVFFVSADLHPSSSSEGRFHTPM